MIMDASLTPSYCLAHWCIKSQKSADLMMPCTLVYRYECLGGAGCLQCPG